jgi:hypothetical protein
MRRRIHACHINHSHEVRHEEEDTCVSYKPQS